MNNDHTKNVTGWLHGLLTTPGIMKIDAADSSKIEDCKQWLADVNTDKLLVSEQEVPETPEDGAGAYSGEEPPAE